MTMLNNGELPSSDLVLRPLEYTGLLGAPDFWRYPPFFNEDGSLPEPPMPNIVSLYSSAPHMGKSTFADYLTGAIAARGIRAVRMSFADPLRELCGSALKAIGYTQTEARYILREAKDVSQLSTLGVLQRAQYARDAFGGREAGELRDMFCGRDLLIGVGDGCRSIMGEDVWCNALLKRIRAENLPKHAFVVIDDMRRTNEYEFLGQLNAIMCQIVRPALPDVEFNSVEGQLDGRAFEHTFLNKGTEKDLYNEAKAFADMLVRSC